MGAVAASVLGAPISTTLIVFELTGNWQVGLVVMVTVSVATSFSGGLIDKSSRLSANRFITFYPADKNTPYSRKN